MKTYNEKTGELIENPDLSAGYTYPGQRYIGTERIVLEGTVARYPPGEKPGTEPDPPDNAPTWEEMADAYTEGVKMA